MPVTGILTGNETGVEELPESKPALSRQVLVPECVGLWSTVRGYMGSRVIFSSIFLSLSLLYMSARFVCLCVSVFI
jgi:hypothetical protein